MQVVSDKTVVGQSDAQGRRPSEVLGRARLTEHDEQVLWALAKYNVLRADHIMKLCYSDLSESRADWLRRNRLGQLVEMGVLGREYTQHRGYAYWLGEVGVYWLQMQGHDMMIKLGNLMLRHDLAVADFMIAAKQEVEAAGGNLEWEGVRETEPEVGVKPDAVGRGQLSDGRRLVFFLELDRNTEVRRILDKKVARYVKNYKEGNWRVRYEREGKYPPVLVVTTGGEARERLLRNVVMTRLKLGDVELPFYFTRFADLGGGGPLGAAAWTTMGSGERQPFLRALAKG